MVFWIFLVIVGFIGLIFATITDIKKREVPDWLNYSLIAIGLGARGIYSLLTEDGSYILYGLLGFAVFFAFSNIMYYTRQWGGGDCKLLMGLGALFGNYGLDSLFGYNLPFLAGLLINIFIMGVFYGVLYALFLGLKNRKKFFMEFRKNKFNEIKIAGSAGVILVFFSWIFLDYFFAKLLTILILIIFVAVILLSFMKVVEKSCMYKKVDVNKLVVGDWLVDDISVDSKVICNARNIGLTKADILKLKNNRIKKVLVHEGIPFVPGFMLGFLVTIIFGDFLIFIF